MVTRKPVPNSTAPAPQSHIVGNPPYPTTPIMPSQPGGMHPGNEHTDTSAPPENHGDTRSRASSISSHGTWDSDPSEPEDEGHMDTSQQQLDESQDAWSRQTHDIKDLPASLRPGALSNGLPSAHHQDTPAQMQSAQERAWQAPSAPNTATNPYLNPQNTGQAPYGTGSRMSVWGEAVPPQPSNAPPPPPPPPAPVANLAPSEELAGLSLGEHENEAWAADNQRLHPQPATPLQSARTGFGRTNSSNPWQDDLDRENQRQRQTSPSMRPPTPSLLDDDLAPPIPPKSPSRASPRGFSDPDHATSNNSEVNEPVTISQQRTSTDVSQPRQNEATGVKPVNTASESATLSLVANEQRNEIYHIKQINWFDASAEPRGSLRRSPILTQNANGPCPLLALVNALSLSTPAGLETCLTETLRRREQITLGLLMDAVFEELVRRTEISGHDLPDIGELYSFLVTLHTGMNVNPRFVENDGATETSMQAQPGGFEQTREMRLYGAFSLPLVHGWISPHKSGTYVAFERSAPTFDEALNIQFREEELDEKMRSTGLTQEEQQVFEDVQAIKQFLTNYPTQLSNYGLDAISKWMSPGQIVILFRNDHFSTLYKEPRSGTLMTLATDAGYATHDEIVWESLLDVNGAASELMSGDFRPVGNTSSTGAAQTSASNHDYSHGDEDGWQTVQSKNKRSQNGNNNTAVNSPPAYESTSRLAPPAEIQRTASEQEDHDLALALQLQEEEEHNNRRESARREQEENLSRQFLENEQSGPNPPLPPRSRNGRNSQGRNTINVRSSAGPTTYDSSARTDDSQAPPPSYEQAASDRPYREPSSVPTDPEQGNALGALSALEAQQRRQSYNAGQQGMPPMGGRRASAMSRRGRQSSGQFPPGQFQPGGGGLPADGNEQERCIVM